MLRFRSISHRISAINQPTRPCFSLPAPLTRRPTYRSSFSSAPLNPSTTTTTTTTTTTSTNAVPPPQNPPSDHDPNLLLTEYVYGRSRIYTSLPTTSKSPTASKQSISSSITSPLYWRWQRSRAVRPDGIPDATWRRRRKFANLGLFAGLKANLNEMFLPVGYPDTVHECYARFHSWLFLETYIGSAVMSNRSRRIPTTLSTTQTYLPGRPCIRSAYFAPRRCSPLLVSGPSRQRAGPWPSNGRRNFLDRGLLPPALHVRRPAPFLPAARFRRQHVRACAREHLGRESYDLYEEFCERGDCHVRWGLSSLIVLSTMLFGTGSRSISSANPEPRITLPPYSLAATSATSWPKTTRKCLQRIS
ncbi:LOW QUALITY PROTEIN: hypothetical protein BC938DRAFT_471600 [Jimgerdemannia flammicorona]|uniref:Uncharacterized protein n=1 Tax=Jimgerdemannia flammicorona TaxID=994334 RepID=A0A433Q7R2_9FUNG|nr:LOW QUALITY PROTEIN: hypothetical protein BC938DRAFT_471600 [Jimgerdemannia flammicorona]